MVGGIIMVIALVVVIPVGLFLTGGVLAALIGHLLRLEVDKKHEGSELLDLNG